MYSTAETAQQGCVCAPPASRPLGDPDISEGVENESSLKAGSLSVIDKIRSFSRLTAVVIQYFGSSIQKGTRRQQNELFLARRGESKWFQSRGFT